MAFVANEEILQSAPIAEHRALDANALDAGQIWNKSVDILRSHLDPQIFAAWIKPLSIARLTVAERAVPAECGHTPEVELIAPNKFCCNHVERNYREIISSTLTNIIGRADVIVRFKVGEAESAGRLSPASQFLPNIPKASADSEPAAAPAARPRRSAGAAQKDRPTISRAAKQAYGESNLNPKYNFSNFVVGGCNQFAHAVSLRVAENLGMTYNPLFIYGGVGLGKTHLANAIGNASLRRGKNVLLVSSEIFVNELIAALRSNKMPQFKSKFRSLDLLIIDDIQFLIGKERTQEEFFHTFNDLYHRHKQIIVTSDKLPQELIGLEERLRTRFASGLSADLQAPDFETRVAILIKKAEASSISLPINVAELLAEKIDTNVRELEGALNRLQALSSLSNEPITSALANDALRNLIPERQQEITTEMIQRAVAERYNVSINDLLGKRRTQNIAFARHVAMYLCRTLTSSSYPEIGALFGGRDHSTVIHAFRSIEERLKAEAGFKEDLQVLEKRIRRVP